MRKESELILKVIGTDIELGTHGGMTQQDALLASIKSGRDGYKIFRGYSLKRRDYREALLELPPYFNQMSTNAFSRLISLVQGLELHLDYEFGATIKNSGVLEAYCKEQIGKRAMLLQAFSRTSPELFKYVELKAETEVRKQHPWRWIDAMMQVGPEEARKEIIHQLVTTKDFKPMYARMNILAKMPRAFTDELVRRIKGDVTPEELREIRNKITTSRRRKR